MIVTDYTVEQIEENLRGYIVNNLVGADNGNSVATIILESEVGKTLGVNGAGLDFAGHLEEQFGVPLSETARYQNSDLSVGDVARVVYDFLQERRDG